MNLAPSTIEPVFDIAQHDAIDGIEAISRAPSARLAYALTRATASLVWPRPNAKGVWAHNGALRVAQKLRVFAETETGSALYTLARNVGRSMYDAALEGVSAADRETVETVLNRMRDNLSGQSADLRELQE